MDVVYDDRPVLVQLNLAQQDEEKLKEHYGEIAHLISFSAKERLATVRPTGVEVRINFPFTPPAHLPSNSPVPTPLKSKCASPLSENKVNDSFYPNSSAIPFDEPVGDDEDAMEFFSE